MPTIHLTTFIAAPAERVFDLSRSIELHEKSLATNGEKAVAGTVSGLIKLDDTVTWKGKHVGKERVLKSRTVLMEIPSAFTDEMVSGDFKMMKHEHHFKPVDNGVLMIDLLSFETPYGIFGRFFNMVYLQRYLRRLLEQRNSFIKSYAESDKWKFILNK